VHRRRELEDVLVVEDRDAEGLGELEGALEPPKGPADDDDVAVRVLP
jgi:hypothetical protein